MRKNIAIAVLALALLIPATSNAAGRYGRSNADFALAGEVYLGLKYGSLVIDDGPSVYDDVDIRNIGFMFGGSINDNIGLEFDYTQAATKDNQLISGLIARNISSDTLGFYLVGKTTGPVYFKGRLGYVRMEQKWTFLSGNAVGNRNYGIALSVGVGAKIGETGAVELEYTALPDTDFDDVGTINDLESEFISLGYVWIYD